MHKDGNLDVERNHFELLNGSAAHVINTEK